MLALLILLASPPLAISLRDTAGALVTDARVAVGAVRVPYDAKLRMYRVPSNVTLPGIIEVTHPRYHAVRKRPFAGRAAFTLVPRRAPIRLENNVPIELIGYGPDRMAIGSPRSFPDGASHLKRLGIAALPGTLEVVPACTATKASTDSWFITFTPANSKGCATAAPYGPFVSEPFPAILTRQIRIALQPGTTHAQVAALLKRHGLKQISLYPAHRRPPAEVVGEMANGCELKMVDRAARILRDPIVRMVTNEITTFICPC